MYIYIFNAGGQGKLAVLNFFDLQPIKFKGINFFTGKKRMGSTASSG